MIVVEGLEKCYVDGEPVLRGVSFSAERGSVYTLLGPSGCGKTTSLRCVAGLEVPESGRIALGQRTVFSAAERVNFPPDKRNIGRVFQSYAIWPHMTVAQNIAYPLQGRGLRGGEVRRRVGQALELVGMGDLGSRPATDLSGGQQQRVALARAIVGEPEVLLLDEPLSNLDAKLREQMRRELTTLQRRLGHTMLYVTHDQEEALALSHRLALMRDGEIVEEGDPMEMYLHPHHPFTASFLGHAHFLDCRLDGQPREGERIEVETVFGRFTATARQIENGPAKLFFRPHQAQLEPGRNASGANYGSGCVVDVTFLGESVEVFLRKQDETVRLRVQGGTRPAIGEEIGFSLDPDYAIAFVPAVGSPA